MRNHKWIVSSILLLIVLTLCSCGVKDETGIVKNLLKSKALESDYTNSSNMNNYLRSMRGYTGRPTFVFDENTVYFEDIANYYTLRDDDDFVTYLPRQQVTRYEDLDAVESVIHGVIIDSVLYNGEQSVIYSANKNGEMAAWQISMKKESDETLYIVGHPLPYKGDFYFVQDETLYRCSGNKLEYYGRSDDEELFVAKSVEKVFDSIDVNYFGIFSNTAVIIDSGDQIWTLDLSSNNAVCVFEGNDSYKGGCCIDDGYIYYVVDSGKAGEGSLARVKFDGTGRETNLLTFNDDILMDYVFNVSNGKLYFLQYSKLNEEYVLCMAPTSNLSAQVALAYGAGHGIDEWVSELYPNGEWVYYGSQEKGFWRAKTDGTLVEKIQEFNNENIGENVKQLTVDVKEQVSDFVFERYELSPSGNPSAVGGYCGAEFEGKNASWKLENGVLTISGSGDMLDLDSYDSQPWANVRFDITSIVVADGITSIGDECFRNLSNVTQVTFPDSLARIGRDAFLFTSLEEISFPSSLTCIGESAFCNLSSIAGELMLPDSVTEIGKGAFYGCTGLTGELHLPTSLCSIGEMAFKDCSGFTGELMIPSGVKKIAQGTFSGCYQLSGTITLSEGVEIVEQNAFHGCSQIETIDLPSTIERIESLAFSQCSGVQRILCHGALDTVSLRNLPYGVKIVYVD